MQKILTFSFTKKKHFAHVSKYFSLLALCLLLFGQQFFKYDLQALEFP
jgi:hypothetical protein